MSLKKTKYAEYIRDFTALGNPFLLLIVSTIALIDLPHFLHNFLVLLAAFFVNEIICSSIKYFWHKPRPNGQKFDNGLEKIDAGSFPSIHASRISLVYLSLSYLHYQVQNHLIIVIFLLIIFAVGYSRIFLKKHFLTDVIAGYTFGSVQVILLHFLLLI